MYVLDENAGSSSLSKRREKNFPQQTALQREASVRQRTADAAFSTSVQAKAKSFVLRKELTHGYRNRCGKLIRHLSDAPTAELKEAVLFYVACQMYLPKTVC